MAPPNDTEACTQRRPADELPPQPPAAACCGVTASADDRPAAAGTTSSEPADQVPATAAPDEEEAEKNTSAAAEEAEAGGSGGGGGEELAARRPAEESARERLKRHRSEMAGRVRIPDMWGQERLLKDWVDSSAVFDRPLAATAGLLNARDALVAECATARRPAAAVSHHGSTGRPLRVHNGCS